MLVRISEKHATIQKHSNTQALNPDVLYTMLSGGHVCFSDHQKKIKCCISILHPILLKPL